MREEWLEWKIGGLAVRSFRTVSEREMDGGIRFASLLTRRDEIRRAHSTPGDAHYTTASGAGGVVDNGTAASGTSGVGVSSTPWPLHSGHELRPVVSHFETN
jgi:hypothetical protein